ncbi:MAG: hypothetical protein EBV15_09320 [Bacteroidetes bacterium]|nr:hypothetical protein [Bacteroidota bacterium]
MRWQDSDTEKEVQLNKGVLVLGAGRSSRFLLKQLAEFCEKTGRKLTVCDASQQELDKHTLGLSVERNVLNASDSLALEQQIANKEMVVSLLPPTMHPVVAAFCLKYKAHFASASYVGDAMRSLDADARANGLVFLNESHLRVTAADSSARHTVKAIPGNINLAGTHVTLCWQGRVAIAFSDIIIN